MGDTGLANDVALERAGAAIPEPEAAQTIEPAETGQVLSTPDVTKAQLVGAVPIVAKCLSAFGVYTLTTDQQEALTLALGGGLALFAADAVIRFGRSLNRAKG